MGRAVRLIEPVFVPDVLVNGIGDIEQIGYGYRLTFYTLSKVYDGRGVENFARIVCIKAILHPPDLKAIMQEIGDATESQCVLRMR